MTKSAQSLMTPRETESKFNKKVQNIKLANKLKSKRKWYEDGWVNIKDEYTINKDRYINTRSE